MIRHPVSSSNVASVGYDVSTSILEIEFWDGGIYQYSGVPEVHFVRLTSGNGSVGSYFHAHIKNRFRYRRIN
jgi:hypothetical protein